MSALTSPVAPKRAAPIRVLSAAPQTLPAAVALGLCVFLVGDQAGYPAARWTPIAVVAVVLLVLTAALVPLHLRGVPRLVWVALGALTAFTAFSYMSIGWAGDAGAAWEGANRTLLYLVVFALFALWPQRSVTAATLLGGWTLAMGALAALQLAQVQGSAHPLNWFVGNRLADPAGYPNANAATWLMVLWPAVAMASARRLPWVLRGVFAAAAVVLAEVALLSLSRGAVFATPIVLALWLAVLPGRVRTLAVLLPVGAAIAAAAPAVLDVGTQINAHAPLSTALAHAARAVVLSSLAAGLIVALGAAYESHAHLSGQTVHRAHRLFGAAALAVLAAGLAGGLMAIGDPGARVQEGWRSFQHGYAESSGGARLTSGLGSNRYDFYRVALDSFGAHPGLGIGVDNYAQDYLRGGRSEETPRYPHSIELRALVQTGVVGSVLLALALAGALAAGVNGARRGGSLRRAVAVGALGAFAYWFVHGSLDWFWEFAGLAAPAFALLGLACAVGPRAPEPYLGVGSLLSRSGAVIAASVAGLALAALLGAPWLAERDVQAAARVWPTRPGEAFARLDRAAALNPLSDRARLIAGGIALRLGDLRRADREFAAALDRNPGGEYATLERGAIASQLGDRAAAVALLGRAVTLSPRDPLAALALRDVRAGQTIDVMALNRSILTKAAQLRRSSG